MPEDSETGADRQAAPVGDVEARPLPRWVIPAGILGIAAVAVGVGRLSSPAVSALFLSAIAILSVVGFLFRTVQNVAAPPIDDEPEELAPTQAEDAKRAALRALRDLEYEKGIGNVSPADYAKLLEKYRAEAKRTMRVVDEERKEARLRAEKLVAQEIAAFLPKADEPEEEVGTEPDEPEEDENVVITCPKCSTKNDADAVFCKKCGHDLAKKEASA